MAGNIKDTKNTSQFFRVKFDKPLPKDTEKALKKFFKANKLEKALQANVQNVTMNSRVKGGE